MGLPIYDFRPFYQYKCEVLRTIDGDTFVGALNYGFRQYMDRSIRVRNLDTAELNSSIEAERIHARAARDFADSLIPVGSTVILVTAKMAIYDRIEADVYYIDPASGHQHSLTDALRANGFSKRATYL